MGIKLNEKGKELYNVWWENYKKENDKLGGNSTEGDYVDGWCIIDNDDYIKTITDECGLLLFAYKEYVFDTLDEWANDSGENSKVCGGFTIAEVRKELLKYVILPKYNVVIHYEGAWNFDIEARNEDEAKEIAEMRFAELSPKELINNLADSFVDGCWEI